MVLAWGFFVSNRFCFRMMLFFFFLAKVLVVPSLQLAKNWTMNPCPCPGKRCWNDGKHVCWVGVGALIQVYTRTGKLPRKTVAVHLTGLPGHSRKSLAMKGIVYFL